MKQNFTLIWKIDQKQSVASNLYFETKREAEDLAESLIMNGYAEAWNGEYFIRNVRTCKQTLHS